MTLTCPLQNQSACSPSRGCLHLHMLSFMGAPQIDVEWQTDLKWNTNRRAALFLKTNCGLCQCEWALVSCFMILRTPSACPLPLDPRANSWPRAWGSRTSRQFSSMQKKSIVDVKLRNHSVINSVRTVIPDTTETRTFKTCLGVCYLINSLNWRLYVLLQLLQVQVLLWIKFPLNIVWRVKEGKWHSCLAKRRPVDPCLSCDFTLLWFWQSDWTRGEPIPQKLELRIAILVFAW